MNALKVATSHTKNYLCGLGLFNDMNTYILIEAGRSFKTFLKENYAIALDSFFLFTKKMLNMELLNMILIFMETLDTPEIYSRFDECFANYIFASFSK